MVAGAAPPKRDELIAAIGKVLFLRLSKEDAQQLFREAGAKPDWKAVQTFTRQMLTSSAAAATLCSHFVAAGAVLNAYLEPEMYIGGMSPCVADIACYCALIPAMQAFDDVHKWALCNVSRWFDHMQSTVESLLPPPELGCDRKVSFNLDMPDPAPTIASLPLLIGAGGAAASATPDVSDPAPAPGGKGGAPKGAAGGAPAAAGGQEDAKKEKKEKKEKPKKEAPPPPPAGSGIDISWADLRVGKILDASKHPDSDKLYVESIDLGEGEPRTICSGIANYLTLDEVKGSLCVVLANLKPRKVAGTESQGMVLCASDAEKTKLCLISPPAGTKPGERVMFADFPGEAAEKQKMDKKKAWEKIQPEIGTNADGVCVYKGSAVWALSTGPVTAGIKGGVIS